MEGVSHADENSDRRHDHVPDATPEDTPAVAARREADPGETTHANRAWWDNEADGYYAEHGSFLGDDEANAMRFRKPRSADFDIRVIAQKAGLC